MVYEAQERTPNGKRFLYLDIDGHRNKKGDFDANMFELQRHFLMGFLMPYGTQLHTPLIGVANNKLQRNDVVADVEIIKNLGRKEINRAIARGIETIWLAEHDSGMRLPQKK